jgi:hypothetical protein
MNTTKEERKTDQTRKFVKDHFAFSNAVMELIPADEAVKIADEHFRNGKWTLPSGEPRTFCSVHVTKRGPRVVVVTEADRSSTLLLTASEVVPIVFGYIELQSQCSGEGLSPMQWFPLGRVVKSRGAHLKLDREDIAIGLFRHLACDWGDLCDRDWQRNNDSLEHSLRILSTYHDVKGEKFYVLTEADRSATTVLLAEEY